MEKREGGEVSFGGGERLCEWMSGAALRHAPPDAGLSYQAAGPALSPYIPLHRTHASMAQKKIKNKAKRKKNNNKRFSPVSSALLFNNARSSVSRLSCAPSLLPEQRRQQQQERRQRCVSSNSTKRTLSFLGVGGLFGDEVGEGGG